jgi:hypothetical protein
MKLRKVVTLWFATAVTGLNCGVTTEANAQVLSPTPCNKWEPPPVSRAADSLLVQLTTHQGDVNGIPGYYFEEGARKSVRGRFLPPAGKVFFKISIWDGYLKGNFRYFTPMRGAELFFKPDSGENPIPVKFGLIRYPIAGLTEFRHSCVFSAGGSLEDYTDDAEFSGEAPMPDDGVIYGPPGRAASPSRPKIIRPRQPAPTIGSLIPKRDDKAAPELAPPKTPIAELMPAPKPPVAAAKPADAASGKDLRICLPPAMTPITWPWNLDSSAFRPEKPIVVGRRSVKTTARLYEYINVSSSYIPKGEVTLKKNTSYLTGLEFAGRAKTEIIDGNEVQVLPVTIPGIDLSAAVEIPKTGVPLKIMVVGAPEEISISGLERIGKELEKDAKLDIKLQIEWHEVTATGDLLPPVTLEGLPALVRAAREKARKDYFITPNAQQFSDFITKFKAVMTNRTQPVDRVIWVKGAYILPNAAPVLIQDLLDAVAASRAVPRTPSGDIERWLYVVTARMPGFSVNYVKEPVNASNAGDVFMEREMGGPSRRLLDGPDAATFVRNISGAAMVRTRSGPAAARPAVNKLILNANEILTERGYLLSPVALQQLAERLRLLSGAWDSDGKLTATAEEVVKNAGDSSSTSIADVVAPILPMLSPFSNDLVGTSIKSLSDADQKLASVFVTSLGKLSEDLAKELKAEGDGGVKLRNCDFVYMSANRIQAAAADAKLPAAAEEIPEAEPAAAPEADPVPTADTDAAPDATPATEPAARSPEDAATPPAELSPDPATSIVPENMTDTEETNPAEPAEPELRGPAP